MRLTPHRLAALLKRLYREVVDDAITDSAASLSYYFIFAIFPFLFFLATLTAYLPLADALDEMLGRLANFMPAPAFELLAGHLTRLVDEPRPKLLTLGLLTTLWSASRGVDAFRKALNLAYDVKETRPFWRTQLLAVEMTFAGAILVLGALAALVLGGRVGLGLAGLVSQRAQFEYFWPMMRWPISALAIMTAAAINYYLLPDVKQQFRFITPGSVAGTFAWLGATYLFTLYVEHFNSFNLTYGSIGGVMVLLLWLYVTGFIFIVGGELNATLEQVSEGGKRRGARAPGEAPEPALDRPSQAPPGAAKRADATERSRLRWWRKIRMP